jgi:hypothetical protein
MAASSKIAPRQLSSSWRWVEATVRAPGYGSAVSEQRARQRPAHLHAFDSSYAGLRSANLPVPGRLHRCGRHLQSDQGERSRTRAKPSLTWTLNGWSDDNTGNEIGDVCSDFSDVHEIGGYYVQSEWGGNLAGDPCAATVPGTGVLQVFYCASDNSLRTYWRDPVGGWQGEHKIGGSLAGNPYTAVVP